MLKWAGLGQPIKIKKTLYEIFVFFFFLLLTIIYLFIYIRNSIP